MVQFASLFTRSPFFLVKSLYFGWFNSHHFGSFKPEIYGKPPSDIHRSAARSLVFDVTLTFESPLSPAALVHISVIYKLYTVMAIY